MRHLRTNDITNAARMPIKQGTLEHLQAAYGEAFTMLVDFLTNANLDPMKMYILAGAEYSFNSSVPSHEITDGIVYWNGELYPLKGNSLFASSGDVPIAYMYTDYLSAANADPVMFTDQQLRNVHACPIIKLQMGIAGGAFVGNYVCDYFNAVRICPPVAEYTYNELWGTNISVAFGRHHNRFFNPVSGTANLGFDLRNAARGATTRIEAQFNAGVMFSAVVPIGGGFLMTNEGGINIFSVQPNKYTIMYFTYYGEDASGNDRISYRIYQY